MKKICIIGANGQLGNELQQAALGFESINYTAVDIDTLDISKPTAVASYFENNSFDFVINCAAYTAVDLAETEKVINNLINNQALEYLAKACIQQNAILIHISTDFVFDGSSCLPLLENNPTNPLQEYGKAKLKGEQWVQNGIVIRTSWLYSSFGKNFVKTMMALGASRDSLNVIDNQVGTPTYAADLADVILTICSDEKVGNKLGLYHYSNEGIASWYDFAQCIMEYAEIDCRVNPIPDKDYPTPAKRPSYSVLNKSKIKESFDIKIPYWRTSVNACIQKLIKDES